MHKHPANDWYRLHEPGKIDSPALLVYTDRVKQNIQRAINMAGGVDRLRPHIKTCKSPGAVRLMQQVGIYKFKCATISEAEMLGKEKAKDVLLAYQPTGPKLERFVSVIKRYSQTNYSCLVDNMETAKEQVQAFSQSNLRLSIYIDLNIGMNRSGILPGKSAIDLIKYLSKQDVIKNIGLHVYDGHISQPSVHERDHAVKEIYEKLDQFLQEMELEGLIVHNIIAGGSPTFPMHAKRDKVECSPGTFIYWDKSYSDICPEQNFLCAAVVLCRVVSLPGDNLVTIDLGHKSIASENEITRRVFFPDEKGLVPVSHSEEHLVLRNDGDQVYKIGDVLYGIPFHVCPTVALYERGFTIYDGHMSGEWINVARDRTIGA